MTAALLESVVNVKVKRIPSNDGRPLYRAWLLADPFRARHGRTVDEAFRRLIASLELTLVPDSTDPPPGATP